MRIGDDQGWHGDMSDTWRGEDELVKAIRAGLKEISPDCKWSVTRRKTTFTPIITVALMEAPEYPVSTWTNGGYNSNVNGFTEDLADWFCDVLIKVDNFLDSLNYNHSDSMRDYFDVGFSVWVGIGKWDKPFKLKGAKK